MDKMETLQTHFVIAMVQNVTVLLLCICGMVLNVLLLVLFFRKKQVRNSVYTSYMIQIAVTDFMVCVVWLVMAAMSLDELPSDSEVIDIFNNDTNGIETYRNRTMTRKNFSIYRFTYAIYNFHYYNNIFLLATMSVERCVAVWKSLRCQRYEFNRKFIRAVSILMWLLALACALPSFIDPHLITKNEKTDIVLQNLNTTKSYNSGLSEKAMSATMISCVKPLKYALHNKQDAVRDYDSVSVRECLRVMMDYDDKHNRSLEAIIGGVEYASLPMLNSNETLEDELNDTHFNDFLDDYDDSDLDRLILDEEFQFPVDIYQSLFNATVYLMTRISRRKDDINDLCDPRLSEQAKYYQVIVNLVIGFFLPFAAIMVTNLAIALMIGNRARHRLESDNGDEGHDDSTVRRMSSFLKYFGQKSETKTEEASGIYKKSPVLRRKSKARQKMKKNCRTKEQKTLLDNQEKKLQKAAINLQPATPSTSPSHGCGPEPADSRPRLSSFTGMRIRRISGGSASSVESFPTDLTSLHTTSPSPGVRLSAPLFLHNDGKVRVQRACSADSSATGSGCSHGHQGPANRWSSEVFKSNFLDHEQKAKHEFHRADRDHKEPDDNDGSKIASRLPSRVETATGESTQELLPENHTRMYATKSKPVIRHGSNQFNDRGRACSVASRTSGGGERKKRKTLVFKNAERQMRISKSVLAYVLVFAICWLPQRIVTAVYVMEGFMGKGGVFCHLATSSTRILSFFSVLLNPIVYAVTQRELRHYIRLAVNWICKCICPHKWLRKNIPSTKVVARNEAQHNTGTNDNGNYSAIALNNLTTEEVTRQERHARNKERWSRMFQRLGRKSFRFSMSASAMSSHAGKPSDGTIDEEREEEKRQSSKGQSLSISNKTTNGTNGSKDKKELIDTASAKDGEPEYLNNETVM